MNAKEKESVRERPFDVLFSMMANTATALSSADTVVPLRRRAVSNEEASSKGPKLRYFQTSSSESYEGDDWNGSPFVAAKSFEAARSVDADAEDEEERGTKCTVLP
jgi:hypothetical protein